METSSDAFLAQMMGMGFEQEEILTCQLSLRSTGTPITVQSATEWLLQNQQNIRTKSSDHTQSATPTLRLGDSSSSSDPLTPSDSAVSGISRPVSTGSDFSTQTPVKSRYDFGDEKRRQREEYDNREREEAVRKARERRMAEFRAREAVKQQIAEDRQRRLERARAAKSSVQNVETSHGPATSASGSGTEAKTTPTSCRVQVRLPDGGVVRSSFPSSSSLDDVCRYVQSQKPFLTVIQLVQPFPHKEFTPEEHSQTLQELGLCPSASLVVSRQPQLQTQSPNRSPLCEPEPMETLPSKKEPENMDSDDDDDEEEEDVPLPPRPGGVHPGLLPPGGGRGFPPPGAGGGLFPPMGRGGMGGGGRFPFPPMGGGGGVLPPPMHFPGAPFPGQQIQNVAFGGEGHRLGGKETPLKFGDPQEMSRHVSENALAAAKKRAKILSEMNQDSKAIRSSSDFPTLEVLSLRCLARWSSVDYLPSCSALPTRVAHRLISGLAEAKQLHPKTLNAFLKCPLQTMVLDNYCYATNHLIEMLRCFPSLTHLSLVSCTLITDKSVAELLRYLTNLVHLNLNGCHQLSDDIFTSFKGCHQLSVVRVSQLKLTDTGVQLLLRQPLESLRELDLSFTSITAQALALLPRGAPCLESLNLEGTKVSDVSQLLSLDCLKSLNVSQCPLEEEGRVGTLSSCKHLTSLSLSQIPVGFTELAKLECLPLVSLALPDRNLFFDKHMVVVSGFRLTVLNLTGYCNVTDVGIQHVARMESLTHLSLSRTRLTDEGMPYLQSLINLKQLSLDNTLITDQGMEFTKGLVNLEDLSVSDTRLTSKFLLNGCLDNMKKLAKLNLVRTFIDNEGLAALSIPSLMMLSIDFTCATEAITMETLQNAGCRSLELFRNHNIRQPTEDQLKLNQQQQQQQGVNPQLRGGPSAQNMMGRDNDSDDSYDTE